MCFSGLAAQTFPSLEVSGAGSNEVNGIYDQDGTQNSKPKYVKRGDPTVTIYNDWGDWVISVDGDWFYFSFDNVATPDLVVNWYADFGNSPAPSVSVYGPTINYSNVAFKESTDGNGFIEDFLTLTFNGFNGDFLTGKVGENYLANSKATVTNLPAGLTAQLILTGTNTLQFSLYGAATAHAAANNVSNLTLQLNSTAFDGGDASNVINAVKNNLAIQFRNTLTVCASGCNHTTIQAAVTASASGGVIQLATETYTEIITFSNKEIVILGVAADQTIIQANAIRDQATNRVITFTNAQLILKDVTVRHGKSTAKDGGGIHAANDCKLEMYRCAVIDNVLNFPTTASSGDWARGGGVKMDRALKFVAMDCLFANNDIIAGGTGSALGGGLDITLFEIGVNYLISNCTFSNNEITTSGSAKGYGGGLSGFSFVGVDKGLDITNCTFTSNTAPTQGGGMYFNPDNNSIQTLQNNILYGNTSSAGADLYRQRGILNASHSIIGASAAASGSAINGTSVDVSAADPLLVALASNGGTTQTHAIPANSPAVNTGNDNGSRLDQRGLGTNGVRDMGAFEQDGLAVFGWTGSSNTDWATTNNWASGSAPTANDYVRITKSAWLSGNLPKISSSTTALAKVLEIDPGVEVAIEPGGSFLISGGLENNGQLVLEGDALGEYAQVKFSGASKGTGIITKQQNFSGGWHSIGVPFAGDAGMLGDVGNNRHPNAQNLRYWDAATGNWMNVPDNETQLVPGRGYIAFVGSNGVVESAGIMSVSNNTLNTSVTPILDYNVAVPEWAAFGGGQPNGWNLVANPFLAALDFSSLSGRTGNVEDAFYVWNPVSNAYEAFSSASVAPNGTIAPFQSFWVRATDGNSPSLGTLTYANTNVVQAPGFRKTEAITDHILLEVRDVTNASKMDVLTIALSFDAVSDGFDNGWDARKLMNPGATPSLYSVAGGEATSVNAIAYGPGALQTKILPLVFEVESPQAPVYRIALDDSYLNNTYQIYLEDNHTKRFHDLNKGAYTFQYDPTALHRFKLHIGNSAIDVSAPTPPVSAWVYGNQIHMQSNDYSGPLSFAVMDMAGREVYRGAAQQITIGATHSTALDVALPKGTYLLQWTTHRGTHQIKFIR